MKQAVVIGAGPAGLMAAEVLAGAGLAVTVCEAKPSVGRKFLMAGKSGLNLTKDEAGSSFRAAFAEARKPLTPMIDAFDADAVQAWARGLDQEVFTGSTGRVFSGCDEGLAIVAGMDDPSCGGGGADQHPLALAGMAGQGSGL